MEAGFVYLDRILSHWAEETPDATAVRWPGGSFTYSELEDRVSNLARDLAALGVGPGSRVGIYMDRSQDAILAAYAILRSGAAYVPLDVASPIARLSTIISSCGIELALCDPAMSKSLGELPLKKAIDVSGQVLLDMSPIMVSDAARNGPEDPAYILYTSGTTGVPKGMVHTHKSGLAYVGMTRRLCGLAPTDRVGHHTSLHFDMSIFDIFSAHSAGACTIVLPAMYTKMPASLSKLIEAERISIWYSVPYALIQLAERGALETRDISSLRVVMFGGESILPGQLKRFADFVPGATFINAYGPAEINGCTAKVLSYPEVDGVTPINLGSACEGIDTLVTDQGELLVAGDQLMDGYWNDAKRNAVTLKTIDPGDGIERRYYTTGDLVNVLPNGEFELVGRIGRQVKVRGHRVELDEVELTLSTCEGLSEAAVVHNPSDGILVAYVCPRPDAALRPDLMRTHCATMLPPYAVPSEFVVLADLPRTSTGKIDRLQLSEAQNA